MTLPVTDVRSNPQDQIAHAANVVGRSKDRLAVFLEVHRGRKRIKTATEIADATGLKRKRVLEEAKKLVHKQILKQTERDGDVAYERDGFYYAHKRQIVGLAANPKKLKDFPTKYSPRSAGPRVVINAPKALVRTKPITIDDIGSLSRVKRVKQAPATLTMREADFKRGIQKILREPGKFKDWGGETSDLYTTRLRIQGRRHSAAIAFKGRGRQGLLTPGRMGKNGDQIQRLFMEDADVFLVQYGEQIAPTVIQQMAVFAQAKSLATGRVIVYGTIDGHDSARIAQAYPREFERRR